LIQNHDDKAPIGCSLRRIGQQRQGRSHTDNLRKLLGRETTLHQRPAGSIGAIS